MNKLIAILALCTALFSPVTFAGPVFADGPTYCFTKALNGETIDPPVCGVAEANPGGGSQDNFSIIESCKATGKVTGCYKP